MKLPDITQRPVGEFAQGNIAQPNYQRVGKAFQGALQAGINAGVEIYNRKLVSDVDEATGQAAKELTELKTILVNENTVDADWVGDSALGEI